MECEVELIDGTCRVVCQHEALVSGLLSRFLRDTAAYANLKGIVVMLNPPLHSTVRNRITGRFQRGCKRSSTSRDADWHKGETTRLYFAFCMLGKLHYFSRY